MIFEDDCFINNFRRRDRSNEGEGKRVRVDAPNAIRASWLFILFLGGLFTFAGQYTVCEIERTKAGIRDKRLVFICVSGFYDVQGLSDPFRSFGTTNPG